MNILHTSDWHLGHSLFGKKRHEEFRRFLQWIKCTVESHHVETLLIAGDIFDSSLPGNQTQALYYQFLHDMADSTCPCRHIVITSGNHDSPTFLDAPRELLKTFGVHVIGQAGSQPEDEVLLLKNNAGEPELIVCAVPFLRDRDLYRIEPGNTPDKRDEYIARGLEEHYRRVALRAEDLRTAYPQLPVIAMGHLFVTGGITLQDGGVRPLQVGSLGQIDAKIFPHNFDYVALGHLHIPQQVQGKEHIRYSGSPLPMGFAESRQKKQVCLLTTQQRQITIQNIFVPTFQKMQSIQGTLTDIEERLHLLEQEEDPVWVEVIHTSEAPVSDLRARIQKYASEHISILRIRENARLPMGMDADADQYRLEDMNVQEVFERRLQEKYPLEERDEQQKQIIAHLLDAYKEIVEQIQFSKKEDS